MRPAKSGSSSPSTADKLRTALTGQGGTLLLRGGRVLNVFSGEVLRADVLVLGDEIVSVGETYTRAEQILDCPELFILPGFIDGHVHIESSMLHPAEFCRLLVMHGTTAVVADPHEIANVLGVRGFEYMLAATEGLPLDCYFMAPSCVPATNMETAGGRFEAREIAKLIANPRVLGLAEFMNFPGVISGTPEALAKLAAAQAQGKLIDGHAPGLRGSALQAYVTAGIGSDHESTTRDEAREKLRAGMRVMIREGSAARNLSTLLPMVTAADSRRFLLVTDDVHPGELLRDGHLDVVLRKAVALGLDAASAVQMVTLNVAEYFGLKRRGAIAPGYQADLVAVSSLEQFNVVHVVKSGAPVVVQGKPQVRLAARKDAGVLKTMHCPRFTASQLKLKARPGLLKVIRLIPEQIVTIKWVTEPRTERGWVVADKERDIAKLCVIERHQSTGNVGLGLVAGFGLKKGALASSVAHDAHNIIVVGMDDRDMYLAAKRLLALGGGFVAVANGKVAAELALPIAGLMSPESAEDVARGLDSLLRAAHNWGSRLHNPFVTLSFLALPVIPELKLTDKGLVDVNKFQVVSLWGED